MSRFYEIFLNKGEELNSIDQDTECIFASFSLPSWLNFDYGVRVLSYNEHVFPPYYVVRARQNPLEHNVEQQLCIFVQSIDWSNLTILHYVQTESPPLRGVNPVNVRFTKHSAGLVIRIEDAEGFFGRMFQRPKRERAIKFQHSKKQNELEYRYIQPEDRRFQQQSQGGGAKGVAYAGAYQALKDLFPNRPIKSVIGSSAGGLISLIVSGGLEISDAVEAWCTLSEVSQDKLIKSIDDLTPERLAHYNQIIEKIGQFLHDHGILTKNIFDVIREDMMKEDLIEKILEVICNGNQAMQMIMSMDMPVKKTQSSIFKGSFFSRSTAVLDDTSVREPRLLNYYGFLQGCFIRGDRLAEMASKVLYKYLILRYNSDPLSFCRILRIQPIDSKTSNFLERLQQLSHLLTFRDYYLLTDRVQLTFTTVDIDDCVLRCLNHKTTPYLPVCRGFQMTASYSVIFEPIRWRKEWGKYYIHYANTRKQIQLTDHRFTDGGILANFPIRFLDNESVRPMYFSHMSNRLTKVFGFGLEELSENDVGNPVIANQKGMKELLELVRKRLPLFRILYEQLMHTPPPQFIPVASMATLSEIPFLKAFGTVIHIFIYGTDNFVRECFGKDIYLIEGPVGLGKIMMSQEDLTTTIKKHTQLRSALTVLSAEVQASIYPHDYFVDYVKECARPLFISPRLDNLIEVKSLLLKTLKNYGMYMVKARRQGYGKRMLTQDSIKSLQNVELILSELLRRTEEINRQDVFRSDYMERDVQELCKVLAQWESQVKLTNVHNQTVRATHTSNLQSFSDEMRHKTIAKIDTIVDGLERLLRIQQFEIRSRWFHNNKLTEDISNLSRDFPFKMLPGYATLRQRIDDLDEHILLEKQQFERNRTSIYQYIQRMVGRGNSNNIHLVLESNSGLTAKYYLYVFRLTNEYLFANEAKKIACLVDKITKLVLQENFRRDPVCRFRISYSDVYNYLSKNYEHIGGEIVFDYQRFTVTPLLQQHAKKLIAQHKRNISRVTSITCSSVQCFLAFLFTLGLEDQQILRQMDMAHNLLQIDYGKINREFYQMDWALSFKCRVREFEEVMWSNRYDFFESVQEQMKCGLFEGDLTRIKREYEEGKEHILDSYHLLIDYVIGEETKALQVTKKTYEEYLAEKLSVKYGSKNYRKINEKIGKDTKRALQLIYLQFQGLIRHLIYTYSQNESLEFLIHQKDLLKREAVWKGLIMSNLINVHRIKSHIQDLLTQHNLPRDIRLKEYNDYCTVKIELTFVALDITSHCIEFINYHTYPHMPLWAAILTGAAHSPLSSPLRIKPSWSQSVDANNELRHLNSFFNGGSWSTQPMFVSGSALIRLPLEDLTNHKIRQVYYANNSYTFLSFGVKQRPRTRPVVESLFYRRFLNLWDTVELALNMRGIQAAFSSKTQTNVLIAQLFNETNLAISIYNKELLQLPIRLGTLEFVKIKQPDITARVIEESYYRTLEKFEDKKRTCIRLVVRDGQLVLQFVSKQRNNKDLYRRYKVFYRLQGQRQEELQKDELTIDRYALMDSLELKFQYIDRNQLGGKHGCYAVFQRRFRIDLTPLRYFATYNGLYLFPYSAIVNGAINLLKPPTFTMRPQYEGSVIFHVFVCKSLVDVGSTGLYCENCNSYLTIQSPDQLCLAENQYVACSRCGNRSNARFLCRQSYGSCSFRYCVKCCKAQAIFRSQDGICCVEGHEFVLRQQPICVECDLCHKPTNSHFVDETCEITLCHSCSAELPIHEFTS